MGGPKGDLEAAGGGGSTRAAAGAAGCRPPAARPRRRSSHPGERSPSQQVPTGLGGLGLLLLRGGRGGEVSGFVARQAAGSGQCGAHSAPSHLLRQHSGPDAPPGRQAGACRQGSSAINTPPPLPMLLHQREPAKSRPNRPPAKGFTSLRSRAALVEARQCCMVGGALVPSVWSAECGKLQQRLMQTADVATRIDGKARECTVRGRTGSFSATQAR